jgi:hypothetical protein
MKVEGGRFAAGRHLNFVLDLVSLDGLAAAIARDSRTMPGPGPQRLLLPPERGFNFLSRLASGPH